MLVLICINTHTNIHHNHHFKVYKLDIYFHLINSFKLISEQWGETVEEDILFVLVCVLQVLIRLIL